MKPIYHKCISMLTSLMLVSVTGCSGLDPELTECLVQNGETTRAYTYSCTLDLQEPSALATSLSEKMGDDAGNVQELILSGKFSADDATYLRNNLSNVLQRLDLSGVTFQDYATYQTDANGNIVYNWEDVDYMPDKAFDTMKSLTEVVLPENLKTISRRAFSECTSLQTVQIPKNLDAIEEFAFYKCEALNNVDLPNQLTSIGEGAFYNCSSLESIVVPSSVTTLGENTFCNTKSLKSVKLLANIASIPDGCFQYCVFTDIELSESIVNFGDGAFWACSNLNDTKLLDSKYSYSRNTFSYTGFTDVDLSKHTNLDSIPAALFSGCKKLEKVIFPTNLRLIGESAFQGDALLTDVDLSDTKISEIWDYAFESCGCESVEFPSTLNSIGYYAFDKTQLKSVEIPASVTSIKGMAFTGNYNLTSIICKSRVVPYSTNAMCLYYLYTDENGLAPEISDDELNVIIDGVAEEIVLKTSNYASFHCPKPFFAKKISYTRTFDNYGYYTSSEASTGWKTIALPFTPTKIYHVEKGVLAPFNSGVKDAKPFWLRELQNNEFVDCTSIQPGHPYIIAMPYNPDLYADEYNISGDVTFEAENIEVGVTESYPSVGEDITFYPAFCRIGENDFDIYTLGTSSKGNHDAMYSKYGVARVFECYVTSTSSRSVISMNGKRATTRGTSDDPRKAHPGKPQIDDM